MTLLKELKREGGRLVNNKPRTPTALSAMSALVETNA